MTAKVEGDRYKLAFGKHEQLDILSLYKRLFVAFAMGQTSINLNIDAVVAGETFPLDRPYSENLHYSLVMSLSKKDIEKLRNLILMTVESAEKIFRPSPAEVTQCLNIDLFNF